MTALETVDGGDRACGELLLVLAQRVRALPVPTRIRLIATDPAAVVDLPAWCHLTGHEYLGRGVHPDGRPCYDLISARTAREPATTSPWRLDDEQTHHPSS